MLHIIFDADGEGGDGHDVDDAASDWSRSQVLQDVAVCYSVLQCVAVCCSVLLMMLHRTGVAGR